MLIQAKDHLDPQGLIIESATLLANALVDRLKEAVDVEVSLAGMRGIPSSYFNVVLLRILEVFGVETLNMRVKFLFETDAQRQVFQKSLDAAVKSVA